MINKKDLLLIKEDKVFDIDLTNIEVKNNIFLRRLENVEGYIAFSLDYDEELMIDYHLVGDMICPCALTNEDVIVPFEVKEDEKVAFKESDEGYYFPDEISIEDLLVYIVSPEAPIKVVKKGEIVYPRGDGWAFMTEAEEKKNKVDPRLAILKDYKFDKEEE